MTESEDFYSYLGVLPDAESIVVTAAYRALAARYHPDRWAGSPEVAHARMAQINRAYEVLGNEEMRRAYDARRSTSQQPFGTDAGEEEAMAFSEALLLLEDRWSTAVSVFPKLVDIRKTLAKTSHQLAFAYVTLLLETKRFNEAQAIAQAMENTFLERHFGDNKKILAFARDLIDLGRKDAVKGLNHLVEVLGSNTEPELLIQKVNRDFDVQRHRKARDEMEDFASRNRTTKDKLYIVEEKFAREPCYAHAVGLANARGYEVAEVGGSFFRAPEYLVTRDGTSVAHLKTPSEVVQWAASALAGRTG